MKGRNTTERRGKWKIFRIILVRVIVLAAVVVGYALPMPWRIIVPLTIGTVTILIETLTYYAPGAGNKESKRNERKAGKTPGKTNTKNTGKKDNKKAA